MVSTWYPEVCLPDPDGVYVCMCVCACVGVCLIYIYVGECVCVCLGGYVLRCVSQVLDNLENLDVLTRFIGCNAD